MLLRLGRLGVCAFLGCMLLSPGLSSAGYPWTSEPKRSSVEWWQEKAAQPVGARQKYKYGKYWPPFARPTGEKQQAAHIYHAAHYWPYPYIAADRQYVRNLSQLQTRAGWMESTTLFDYHFEADTNELNRSGKLHLQWIVQNAPQQYRLTFVQSGFTKDVSEGRMESVRNVSEALVGEGNVPPIVLRVTTPVGRPALEVDTIRRSELQTIPAPRIQYTPVSSGEGGAGF